MTCRGCSYLSTSTNAEKCSTCSCKDGMSCAEFCKSHSQPNNTNDYIDCLSTCPSFGQECATKCPPCPVCVQRCGSNATCVKKCPADPQCLKKCPSDCTAGCNALFPVTENYDPNQPVCNNQADFNQALQAGLKYNYQEAVKKSEPWIWVYLVLYLIFFVWAIMLSLQVPSGSNRTLHVVLAAVFGPIYVLSYYLGMLKQE